MARLHLWLLAVAATAVICGVQAARWPSLDAIQSIWSPTRGPASDPVLEELGLGQSGRLLCERPKYRKNLLKVVRKTPYIGLFEKLRGMNKFEASGMTSARGWLWVVFDNLHALGRVDEHFQFRSPDNRLVGVMGEDSQFEGLTYVKSTGHFIAVQEQVDSEKHGLIPFTIEVEIDGDDEGYKVIRRCPVHFEFSAENKGFEGIHLQEYANGTQLLVGLCEGNHCDGGERGRERGYGQMVVSKPGAGRHEGDECGWDVVKIIDIPPRAYFMDYSGMAFKGDRVAVVTQEDSAMYVSYFNWETLEFEPHKGENVFYFPRSDSCEMVWCNVEGVEWLDSERLVIASDKAKSNQHHRCTDKDQSIAIVALP